MSWLSLWPAIPAFILSLGLHSLYMDWIVEPGQEIAIAAQYKTLTEQCAADKKLTEDANVKYQSELDALNSRLTAVKLRKPARCVPVAIASKRPDATAAPAKLLGPYGLDSGWLYDYAGDAERERLKVMGLQEFIRKVWSTRN